MSSAKSPLVAATPQDSGARPTVDHSSTSYFNQQSLQTPSQYQSQQSQQQQLPARSPYSDSQNFMPSSLPVEDDHTYLNTLANAQGTSASQSYLPSSTIATGGRNSPAHVQEYYNGNNIDFDGPSEVGTAGINKSGANAMTNSYNHVAGGASTHGGRFAENWDASQRGSSIVDGDGDSGAHSDGGVSGTSTQLPSRGNTLKKKSSLRRGNSLHRSGSRRSMKAGSVRSLALQSRSDADESHSAFYCPVPTKGNPTEILANRFQAWRKILKDLISYHREIQGHYEQRAKSLQRLAASLSGASLPPGFMQSGGLDEASSTLRTFHKQAVSEAVKAREIEEDVILALTGLRTDLSQKIKEIKNISGDFRNNVDREMDATKKAVKSLQDSLGQAELDSSLTTGRQDPYLLRLMADRQLDRQIQEENYLHQAFLNLERSGRELESIVVGEIQKSYNAYVGILRREVATTSTTVDELREGPISMPKDQEWTSFVRNHEQFIGPDVPIRNLQFITYPGQNHFACQEIRAGLLERKSKYLKSYTAGWYVLSPTHLHEFKSADKMQAPVMSLYLPEQKLGSHSTEGASSSKFVLKGRQAGGLHRGHTWVFRAESYDTMMAWFEDLHALTEKTPQEREDFARGHQRARSNSRASQNTHSSDGVNEEDDEPFALNSPAAMSGAAAGVMVTEGAAEGPLAHQASVANDVTTGATQSRSPGGQDFSQAQSEDLPIRRSAHSGRFPSDLQVNAQRGLEVQAAGIPISPASAGGSGSQQGSTDMRLGRGSSPTPQDSASDYGVIAAAGALPGSNQQAFGPGNNYGNGNYDGGDYDESSYAYQDQQAQQQYQRAQQAQYAQYAYEQPAYQRASYQPLPPQQQYSSRDNTLAAAGAGGIAGAAGAHYYHAQNQQQKELPEQADSTGAETGKAPTVLSSSVGAPSFEPTVPITGDYEKTPSTTDSGKVMGDGSESAALPAVGPAGTSGVGSVDDGVAINGTAAKSTNGTGSTIERPSMMSMRTKSAGLTPSHLHIPGEYPRTPAA
ncbi:phosphatidylinositol 4,5-bisphosphate-binding protein [Sporothrix epigloea]|uniref:Phosphatidylinositol 4,5-bisphosphate-binding protein n=1 Tax=Sporothrix epigloea TaxID=1892477 RepID=A0ABP0DT79_9PEZI